MEEHPGYPVHVVCWSRRLSGDRFSVLQRGHRGLLPARLCVIEVAPKKPRRPRY